MRNNQNRFGAKEQAPQAPAETPGLKFVRPTEFVTLPSGGSYPEGHPLHGQETIEIYFMTAKDEDILSSEQLLKKGLAIERFMENIIVDKRISPSSMYSGDRNAMIISARSSGYGNAYETQVSCPNCQAKSKRVFDLDNPTIKESMESEEDSLVKTEDGYFQTVTPVSKYKIKFRLLNGKDEMDMVFDKLSKKKTKIKGLTKTVTNHFKKIIVSVEEYTDRSIINQFVDTMLSSDSYHLKKCYKIANPNIEIKSDFECESCGHQQELEVPLNADFFWPDS
jgi:hypothetical protein